MTQIHFHQNKLNPVLFLTITKRTNYEFSKKSSYFYPSLFFALNLSVEFNKLPHSQISSKWHSFGFSQRLSRYWKLFLYTLFPAILIRNHQFCFLQFTSD